MKSKMQLSNNIKLGNCKCGAAGRVAYIRLVDELKFGKLILKNVKIFV